MFKLYCEEAVVGIKNTHAFTVHCRVFCLEQSCGKYHVACQELGKY